MSAVFKRLERRDAFISPYTAHKTFTFTSSSFGEVGIEWKRGVSGSFPYNEEALTYAGTKHILFDTFGQVSTEYNWTSSLGTELNILSIPRNLYGLSIKPGSVSLAISGSTTLTDDNGYLLSGSTTVGYISYSKGLLALTAGDYETSGLVAYTASFKATEPILTHTYHCNLDPNEFNSSYNPSLQDTTKVSGSLKGFATGSDFRPYATAVGLYNSANELIAVGKLSEATPILNDTHYTFVVKIDL